MSAGLVSTGLILPYPQLATPPDERGGVLRAAKVCSLGDAVVMGRIRDAQRATFTGDTGPISDEQQRVWWGRNRNRVKAWLYADEAGTIIGYGALIQGEDGRWASSVAITPGYQGRGYGSRILSHMVNAVGHPIFARALLSNPPACAMHNGREWAVTGEDATMRYFETRPRIVDEEPSYALAAYDDRELTLPRNWPWEGR